ncbi:MAG: hypothetical protein M1816_001588 [Peltula sp. TS41687]|nr:MAG: hypothetical protein M1816_001588 [Peltula sp. TS41687]
MAENGNTRVGGTNASADPEERRVLYAALDSFRQWQRLTHYNATHLRRQAFYALPRAHWELLAAPPFSFLDTLIAIDDAIDTNAIIASAILSNGLASFGLSHEPPPADAEGHQHPLDWRGTSTPNDMEKAHTIIRQLYRDWSAEGAIERQACNEPVLEDLAAEFPSDQVDRNKIKVLIPGAGLGRLVYEICRAGFDTEGNEISYHALLASSYLLNHIPDGQQMDLYPWATTMSNCWSRKDQLQCVKIPDVHPGAELDKASRGQGVHAFDRMSMSAADFIVLYRGESYAEMYDAVCTVFFIDTAPNLVRYVETIQHCLKKGGLWINLGPLLWHFRGDDPDAQGSGSTDSTQSDGPGGLNEPGTVELSNEEVILLVEHYGFVIEKKDLSGKMSGYASNPHSMYPSMYQVSRWNARKL